jgi:FkbM family methyltransferase
MSADSLPSKIKRRLIRLGARPGLVGVPGRWLGRRRGWRMDCGARVIIDNPAEYIQSQILAHGAYEPLSAAILQSVLGPGRLFLDVGGNIGNHTLVAASTGARIHAFEPVPRLGDRLLANIRLNGWEDRLELFRCALGAEEGTVTLHEAEQWDDGSHSILEWDGARSRHSFPVPLTTLDLHLAKTRPGPVAAMKVDVEGYEARVIDGARSILDADAPPLWLLETGDRMANQIGESARSVLGRLADRGYEFWSVPEVGHVKKVVLKDISGDVVNYCCLHPRSTGRDAVLGTLRRLGAA